MLGVILVTSKSVNLLVWQLVPLFQSFSSFSMMLGVEMARIMAMFFNSDVLVFNKCGSYVHFDKSNISATIFYMQPFKDTLLFFYYCALLKKCFPR